MKRIISLLLFSGFIASWCFSQTANNPRVTVEITEVVINGGSVYIAVFSNAESFRNETPFISFELKADNRTLSQELSIANGEYVIAAFQDTNNNQKLDYGLFGIPRELVGVSNYSGRGFPSQNFDRQKISINNLTGKITIGLYKF